MKRIIGMVWGIGFLLIGFLASCSMNDFDETEYDRLLEQQIAQYEADSILILNYLEKNGLEAQFNTWGFFYTIHNEGSSVKPTYESNVSIEYKGYLLDGTVFDQTVTDKPVWLSLKSVIPGWRIGVPLIGKGGEMTLYLPSYFGYGTQALQSIPANSVLIFDVKLHEFN
jgi:FKBP-type peptidyl-prolyl cis-trans isomerase FkpA